jgi:hypothetical protein
VEPLNEPLRQWLLGAIGIPFGGDPSLGTQRVLVTIVAVESGVRLRDWTITPSPPGDLAGRIESDLDQMDADTFAAEWGLPSRYIGDDDSA